MNAKTGPITLSVLVVNWNTRDHLLACLHQLLRVSGTLPADSEVIVVDNASADGSADAVGTAFADDPRLRLIRSQRNLNYSAGNNLALEHSRGDLLLLLNPDVRLAPGQLTDLLATVSSDQTIGILTARLVSSEGRTQYIHRAFPTVPSMLATRTRVGRTIDRWLFRGRLQSRHYLRRAYDCPQLQEIEQAAGAFMLIRRSTIDLAGGLFDERFPLLFSDVDLCRRVWQAGRRVVLDPRVAVTHAGSASLRQLPARQLATDWWSGMGQFLSDEPTAFRRSLGLAISALSGRREGSLSTPLMRQRTRPRFSLFGCLLRVGRPPALAPSLGQPDLGNVNPLVSIVIPTYNYGEFLAEAIESALTQDYERVEVIVVDDGSTQDLRPILAPYMNCIRHERKCNGGLSSARNAGVALARGDLVCFLDADNRLQPHFTSRLVTLLLHHDDAALAYSNRNFFPPLAPAPEVRRWDPTALASGNYIDACALFRRTVLAHHLYDERMRSGWEDWEHFLVLVEHGEHGVMTSDRLFDYRRHPGSMTGALSARTRAVLRWEVARRHPWLYSRADVVRLWHRAIRAQISQHRNDLDEVLLAPMKLVSRRLSSA